MACLPLSHIFTAKHHKQVTPECVRSAFQELAQGKERISAADFARFLSATQGESAASEEEAAAVIARFGEKQSRGDEKLDSLDLDEFLELLSDPELNPAMLVADKPTHDMTAPLSHYFIYTSHNSYLTGNQLTSKSSTAPIVTALRSGCRVVELDCWDRKGRIMVLHGKTLTRPVAFDKCLQAIKDNAFVASDYPVIITIENHLPPDIQREAAKIIREILGEMLFLPSSEERPPREFASPEELKRKIIISDKPPQEPLREQAAVADQETTEDAIKDLLSRPPSIEDESPPLSPTGLGYRARQTVSKQFAVTQLSKAEASSQEDNQMPSRTQELEELIYIFCEKPSEMKEAPVKGQLVPGDRSIMANISEPQLRKFVKANADSLIKYTKNNLGRMYPFGLRFDSSNADPFIAWAHGFQLAALNSQGRDRPCWIAQAMFSGNGGCGFVKKPHILLPKSDMTYDQIASLTPRLFLKAKILMGTDWNKMFDFLKKPDFYVKLAIHGMPGDKVKKKTKTFHKSNEPHWEEELFEFAIRVPDVAILRIEVWEQDRMQRDDFVGQACFPVKEIKSGIRSVLLKSRKGEPLQAKLLCWIQTEENEAEPVT